MSSLSICHIYSKSPWDLETYLASFQKSQEWEIVENVTERFEKSRDVGVLLKFSRRVALRFTITAQRRLGYTCHLLMLPCVFLGCMTLVVFCLPPERPDRHTLGKNDIQNLIYNSWAIKYAKQFFSAHIQSLFLCISTNEAQFSIEYQSLSLRKI